MSQLKLNLEAINLGINKTDTVEIDEMGGSRHVT